MPMPKRMRSTRSSRGVSDDSTRVVVSRRFDWIAASIGRTAVLSSMKSPRWLSSSSPIGRLQADRLLGDLQHLAHLLERHGQLLGQFLGRRLAADLVQHLARGADDLVDRLDHVHRDADGARLVGDRTGDRLPDPPGGVGGELIAAAVLELVHRLHQADVAFLDQIKELQAAVGVFLGDRDHQAQVGLDHLLLGLARLALALLDGVDNAAEVVDRHAGFVGQRRDLLTDLADLAGVLLGPFGPAYAQDRHALAPSRIKLRAVIGLEEGR